MDLLISFSFCSQFSKIQRISHFRVLMSFADRSLEDEQLDKISNVVTNSGGAAIGGSCGGLFVVCILIYILYRLCKDDPIVHPNPCWPLYLHVCATCMQILNHLRSDHTSNYLTESVSHRQTELLTDWLTDRQTEGLTDWLTDCHTGWLTDWLTDCLPACLPDWLTDWLTDLLTEKQTDLFTDWLTDWHTDWP